MATSPLGYNIDPNTGQILGLPKNNPTGGNINAGNGTNSAANANNMNYFVQTVNGLKVPVALPSNVTNNSPELIPSTLQEYSQLSSRTGFYDNSGNLVPGITSAEDAASKGITGRYLTPQAPQIPTDTSIQTPTNSGSNSSTQSTTYTTPSINATGTATGTAGTNTTNTSSSSTTPLDTSISALTGQPSSFTSRAQEAAAEGIKNYTGTAAQNAQLLDNIKQKYQKIQSNSTGEAPANSGDANTAITTAANQVAPNVPDAVTNAVTTTTNQLLADMNSKTSTEATLPSIQSYINQESASLGIPALQANLLNIQNVMNGTDSDVRKEISAAGGFATESQVEATVAARNKVLLTQATNIQNSLSNAQQTLSLMTSGYSDDRANAIASLTDKINNDQTTLSLYDNIEKQSVSQYDKIFSSEGWNGLAALNPQAKALYEQVNGLPSGSLSNPAWVAAQQALVYKQQSAALAVTRAQLGIDRYDITAGQTPPSPPSITSSGNQSTGVMGGNITTGTSAIIPANVPDTSIVPNTGGMSVGAVRLAATQYLTTGMISSVGTGNKYARAAISNEASVIQTELGLSDDQVISMRQGYSANLASLTSLQTQSDQSQAFESTANQNLSLAQKLSANVPRTSSPLANNYDLWVSGQLSGDPSTVAFETAVYTAANEYAKVTSGSTGGTTDAAKSQAGEMLSAALNPDQFDKVVGVMQQEMDNRITAYGTQIQTIKNNSLPSNQAGTSIQARAQAAGYDYNAMKAAGYTDDEINQGLNPN